MLDILVSKVVLDCPGIMPLIGQIETTGMPQHVGMHGKFKPSQLASLGDQLANRRCGQRPLSLGHEDVGRIRVVAVQTPQRTNLGASQGVGTGRSILGPGDIQQALLEVDLIPAQGHQFRRSQGVPEGDQDKCAVAMPMTAMLAGCLHEALDFITS